MKFKALIIISVFLLSVGTANAQSSSLWKFSSSVLQPVVESWTAVVRKLGIGSSTPTGTLSVETAAGVLPIVIGSSTGTYLYIEKNGGLVIGTSSNDILTTNAGSVKIIGSPAGVLSIATAEKDASVFSASIVNNLYATFSSTRSGNGTALPIAFFTQLPAAGARERLRIATNGRIGIGTTSPFAKLSIQNTSADDNEYPVIFAVSSSTAGFATTTHFTINNQGIASTSKLRIDSLADGCLNITTGLVGTQACGSGGSNSKWATTTGQTYISPNGATRVGIGSTTPFATFAINPVAGEAPNAFVVGSSTWTSLRLTNGNRLGLNATTTPRTVLEIHNNASSTVTDLPGGNNARSNAFLITSSSSASNGSGSRPGILQIALRETASGVAYSMQTALVGSAESNVQQSGTLGVFTKIESTPPHTGNYMYLDARTDGAYNRATLKITPEGMIGIGIDSTNDPVLILHVASTSIDGDIFRLQDSDGTCDHNPEAGSEVVTCSSDGRLKTNIRSSNTLSELLLYNVKDYDVTGTKTYYSRTGRTIQDDVSGQTVPERALVKSTFTSPARGVIAQELEQVMPDKVKTQPDGMKMVTLPSIWDVVSGIQSLWTMINANTTRIEALENENAELRSRLDALEAKIL